jgi:Glycosyl transferase family 2
MLVPGGRIRYSYNMITLVLLGLGLALELALHLPGLQRMRVGLALAAMLATAFATGTLLVWNYNFWSVMFGLVSLYRILNDLRIVEGRMHEHYLHRATLRTSLALAALQAAGVLAWWAWDAWHETGQLVWALAAAGQLAAAIIFFSSTRRRMQRTAWPTRVQPLSDAQLPTLTVAIPARNETEDLQACLESLIRSDYPKLEILVLDDCSQTRRTPEIIRGYAHDGVRFVRGEEPQPIWLPKNQAYDHLVREASGEYILFCGVDVRFEPQALRQLVAGLLNKKKDMMSVLPWRAALAERRFVVIQAMRYFWELAPPRRLFKRPPVLSTCWIIRRQALLQQGGFEAVRRAIVPEAHFARQLSQTDTYSFMRASQSLGLQSIKPATEQLATAVRMRYPQLHRRPENVLIITLAYGGFLLLPFVVIGINFWVVVGWPALLMAGLAAVLLVATYEQVVVATRTGSRWFGLLAFPAGILYDLYLIHYSMLRYEFSEVDWKGRNICIPAMHVIPRLPRLD